MSYIQNNQRLIKLRWLVVLPLQARTVTFLCPACYVIHRLVLIKVQVSKGCNIAGIRANWLWVSNGRENHKERCYGSFRRLQTENECVHQRKGNIINVKNRKTNEKGYHFVACDAKWSMWIRDDGGKSSARVQTRKKKARPEHWNQAGSPSTRTDTTGLKRKDELDREIGGRRHDETVNN